LDRRHAVSATHAESRMRDVKTAACTAVEATLCAWSRGPWLPSPATRRRPPWRSGTRPGSRVRPW
jgi:hypothetical protein